MSDDPARLADELGSADPSETLAAVHDGEGYSAAPARSSTTPDDE